MPEVGSPLIRTLKSTGQIVLEHAQALRDTPVHERSFASGQDIVLAGEPAIYCIIVLKGFAASSKIGTSGKRQITAFHIPGDMPDLQTLHLDRTDTAISALHGTTVAFIRHDDIRALCHRHPEINDAFWRLTLIDAARLTEWMFNVGQRQASTRLAHLFCEIYVRMRAVGLAADGECAFPVAQTEIADATGISPVHVNRMIQELRHAGLIRLAARTLQIPDLPKLMHHGDFDPAYLHLATSGAA